MRHYYPDVQKYAALRQPDWRWQRANYLVENGRYFSRQRDDQPTGRAVRYLQTLAWRRGSATACAARRYPDVHAARQLQEDGGTTKLLIQARLLARQTTAEIAGLTDTTEEVIDTYENLFFRVCDRLNAPDWIMAFAVRPEFREGTTSPDPAGVLKSFAYCGGPMALEAVLPYLVEGKDLYEPALALSTPEGRCEQRVRLAVAVALLPHDESTEKKMHQMMISMLEMDQKCTARRFSGAILAENVEERLTEVLAAASWRHPWTGGPGAEAMFIDKLREVA